MKKIIVPALFVSIAIAVACTSSQAQQAGHHHHHDANPWAGINKLVAVMHPTQGHTARGVITFTQSGEEVKVVAEIEGLSPNGTHAIHIHEFGDATSADGSSAGGHYNPEGHDHGLPNQTHRHAGDLGNLHADENGKVRYELTVRNITLADEHNPIVGRGVIIHVEPDDGSQPVGNAGGRISMGVIGIAKP